MSDKTALSCYNRGSYISETARVCHHRALPLTSGKGKFPMATSHATPIQLPLPLPDATIEIPLTRGYVTVVSQCDADLASHKWHAIVKLRNGVQQAYASGVDPDDRDRKYALHRFILGRMLGRRLQSDEWVDHIDGNPLNNTRANLRLATVADNNRNQRRTHRNASGFKGVSYDKQRDKWRAYISVDNKDINLGRFDTPEEAHEAYKQAALRHFGEFARFE